MERTSAPIAQAEYSGITPVGEVSDLLEWPSSLSAVRERMAEVEDQMNRALDGATQSFRADVDADLARFDSQNLLFPQVERLFAQAELEAWRVGRRVRTAELDGHDLFSVGAQLCFRAVRADYALALVRSQLRRARRRRRRLSRKRLANLASPPAPPRRDLPSVEQRADEMAARWRGASGTPSHDYFVERATKQREEWLRHEREMEEIAIERQALLGDVIGVVGASVAGEESLAKEVDEVERSQRWRIRRFLASRLLRYALLRYGVFGLSAALTAQGGKWELGTLGLHGMVKQALGILLGLVAAAVVALWLAPRLHRRFDSAILTVLVEFLVTFGVLVRVLARSEGELLISREDLRAERASPAVP
jgi:hypothetical protein